MERNDHINTPKPKSTLQKGPRLVEASAGQEIWGRFALSQALYRRNRKLCLLLSKLASGKESATICRLRRIIGLNGKITKKKTIANEKSVRYGLLELNKWYSCNSLPTRPAPCPQGGILLLHRPGISKRILRHPWCRP